MVAAEGRTTKRDKQRIGPAELGLDLGLGKGPRVPPLRPEGLQRFTGTGPAAADIFVREVAPFWDL